MTKDEVSSLGGSVESCPPVMIIAMPADGFLYLYNLQNSPLTSPVVNVPGTCIIRNRFVEIVPPVSQVTVGVNVDEEVAWVRVEQTVKLALLEAQLRVHLTYPESRVNVPVPCCFNCIRSEQSR